MTKSGMHDNDALHFVQVAMWEFPGFTPIAVYYFYTRCKEHLDIDSIFQLTMDESLKGNSITVANDDSGTTPSSEESKLTRPSKGDDNLSINCFTFLYPFIKNENKNMMNRILIAMCYENKVNFNESLRTYSQEPIGCLYKW